MHDANESDPGEHLEQSLAEARARVVAHPLYQSIQTLAQLRGFMAVHAFAVWDFMSLLKRLQRDLTHVEVPWQPPRSARAARLINEIVLGEESDLLPGRATPISHFELYLEAMEEVGADTRPIRSFVEQQLAGQPWQQALRLAPAAARPFVTHTLTTAVEGATHEVAASFLVGREDPIPSMFRRVTDSLERAGLHCPALLSYLDRHIVVDEGEHAPLGREMLRALCGRDGRRWAEAERAGGAALAARAALWDAIAAGLPDAG